MDRAKIPQVAAPSQLPTGFVVLSGGIDFKGHQIACFPPKSLIRMHLNSVSSMDLVALVEYYIAITKPEQRMSGLAFLADFRACSQSIFRVIIDALEALQRQNRGSVAVFYVMMPRGKELVKNLQKLLGLYQKKSFFSRKMPEPVQPRPFQSVLLSNSQDLYQFVSRDQLMSDFGGTLNYDHNAWMKLRTTFDELLSHVNAITETVPEAISRLEMLKEFENPVDEDECQEMVLWMQNKFQEVSTELMLDAVSQRVVRLAESCRRPEMSPDLLPLTKNPLLAPHAEKLERLSAKLEEMRQLMRKKWREAEVKLIFVGQLEIYRRSAEAAMEALERSAAAAVKIRSSDVASQAMAEDARERLRLQVGEPAASRIAEARELLKKVRKLAMSASEPGDPQQRQPGLYAAELEARITGCADALKGAEDWIAGLCAFFDCCGRILRWYKRCLERLPVDLLNHHERMRPGDTLNLTSRWVEAVKPLTAKHACPKPTELDEARQGMQLVESLEVRREVNLLLSRVEILTRLLEQRNITVREFHDLLDWRAKEASPRGDPDIVVLEPSPSTHTSVAAGPAPDPTTVDDYFEAELRDLEDSISQHNTRSHQQQQQQQFDITAVDNASNLTTGSSDARKYRKKREARQVVAPLHQQPLVREYRPRSNLGVEIDDGPQGVALESQPKAETVWKFLENMASPHSSDSIPASYKTDERDDSLNHPASSLEYPFGSQSNGRPQASRGPTSLAAAPGERSLAPGRQPDAFSARQTQPERSAAPPRSTRSLGSGSHGGRSLSDLVGELKELGDALFGGGGKHPRAPPVSRKQQKAKLQQQQAQPQGYPSSSLPLRASRSVENLMFVSPEGDPMRRVAAPRLLGAPHSATLPSRAASERLLLNDEEFVEEPLLAPEEFALLAAEPPLYGSRKLDNGAKKTKSDSGLSAVSAIDSALSNWRRERDDQQRQERDRRLQELLREADRCLAQPDDNQSDSGLSDHTMPHSVIDFRSRAAWGKNRPPGGTPITPTASNSAVPGAAAGAANNDSGRPGSESDDIDQIISDIHEIAAGRYPQPVADKKNMQQLPPMTPRGRAFSDYGDEDGRQPGLRMEKQQLPLPHLHGPMSRMSDTDLAAGSSLLRPSRHSDNFLLSGGSGPASAARSHSPQLASPPPSIPEDDLDDRSLRTRQQRQQQRQFLNVRRYNRDTPDAINPLSNDDLSEQIRPPSDERRYQGNGGQAQQPRQQLRPPDHHPSGASVFY